MLATYLFEYGWENIKRDSRKFIELIKALIRYCYFMGSTTTVKFRMYEYIKQITHKQEIGENRISDLNITRFDWVGTLRKGYALLAYYLTTNEPLSFYSIDQVYTQNDVKRYALSPLLRVTRFKPKSVASYEYVGCPSDNRTMIFLLSSEENEFLAILIPA